ncbi:MAG: formylglycine-generating enzyme family protein [Chloroflexota bacterium]
MPNHIHQTAGDHSTQIGQISGDVHIGDRIFSRSAVEALRDCLERAIPAYENRLLQTAWRAPHPNQPYKFLYAYELADAAIFFGRETAVHAFLERVRTDRLTIFHAKSGAGKTSLFNAGLALRLLRDGLLPVAVRSGSNPVLALKRTLVSPSLGVWPELLHEIPLPELLGLACSCTRPGQEWVIFFDQFEEFFTGRQAFAERQPFIRALADCYEDPALPVRFILGIRDDYLAELADFESCLHQVFGNRYRLQTLSRSEAADVITGPLRVTRSPLHYDPPLLEALLGDLAQTNLEPPHVQIVCTRLVAALPPGEVLVTEGHYQALGRADGILGSYLQQAVEALGPYASLGRSVLIELVTSESTRQALTEDQLRHALQQHPGIARLSHVLAALVDARLVQRSDADGESCYELAHDTLIAAIRAWVTEDDLQARRAREILRQAQAHWHANRWLLDRPALEFIHEQRGQLSHWSAFEAELMLRSAVEHQAHIEIWARIAHGLGVDIWPLLQPALTSPDGPIRANVIGLLPIFGDAALAALRQALDDLLPSVRVRALRSLGQVNTPAALAVRQQALHEVYIPPTTRQAAFFIDRSPVTNAAYETFLNFHPHLDPPGHWPGGLLPDDLRDHPAVNISWDEACRYAAWAEKRLPTAAEWRRAAGERAYPWGDAFQVQYCNTRQSGFGSTTPVGSFSPHGDSPFGVADLAGNIWEWLADRAGRDGEFRALRGGAWFYASEFARSDYAHFWRRPAQRQDTIGFRLCFSVE